MPDNPAQNLRIESKTDSMSAIRAATGKLGRHMEEAGGNPVLLLLSGGSALALLDELPPFSEGRVTVGMLDERMTPDPGASNLLQARDRLAGRNCAWLDSSPRPGETPEETAVRYEGYLRDWKTKNPAGRIIATLGMGPDGHTAGIMPAGAKNADFEYLFDNPDRWVAGYETDRNRYRRRITATFPFLRKLDAAVALVTGRESKAAAWARVTAAEGSLRETPARILREIGSGADAFLDF